jgi:predicted nucleotide-binding protein
MIGLTDLGRRIVAPLEDGDDVRARRQAALTPAVERKFLEKYDGSPLPAEHIAHNVLESMEVPKEAVKRVHGLVLDNARAVGFLKTIKDKTYIDLGSALTAPAAASTAAAASTPAVLGSTAHEDDASELDAATPSAGVPSAVSVSDTMPTRKVFVSHGKNRRVVDQLKELLAFGDFEPVISVERESVSKPVPQKVLDDMRTASAGIIHVSPEERLMGQDGKERRVLNQNVLIEIGAAMALYGDRFILLVETGTTLPSNLQGLYEVRYDDEELGYDATMKVLKALNQFKAASQ